MDERETLTVEETARKIGVSRDVAYRGVKDGTIPSFRVGHRILVPKAALARKLAGGAE